MQARAESKTLLLANLGQPHAALAQDFRVDPFRHQDDTGPIGSELVNYRTNLVQVVRVRHHELELILIGAQ